MNSTAAPVNHSCVDPVAGHHVSFAVTEPVRPVKTQVQCARCHAAQEGAHTLRRLQSGMLQLVYAVVVILASVFRLARLLVAAACTLVGLIGSGIYIAGQHLVHPEDKRLLPRMPGTNRE